MAEIHFMVRGRKPKDGIFVHCTRTANFNHRQAVTEFRQLVNSMGQIGIVNQIEDRESPFNGMLIDMVIASRPITEEDDPIDADLDIDYEEDDFEGDFEVEEEEEEER